MSRVCHTCGYGVTERTLEILREKKKRSSKAPRPPRRRSKKEKVQELAKRFLERYREESD